MPAQCLDIMAAIAYANGDRPGYRASRASRVVVPAIPPGEAEGKQFRTALLNGFGQFFIVLLVLAGYEVYLLLESFLRPLAWAVITGIVLFPFKTFLAGWAKLWVTALKQSNTPLALGLVITPLKLADAGLDYLGDVVLKVFRNHTTGIFWGVLMSGLATIFQLILYVFEVDVITSVYGFTGIVIRVAASNWVWSVLTVYATLITFCWQPRYKESICSISLPVHIALGIHLTARFGAMALPGVIFGGAILGIGFLSELRLLIQSIKQGAHHDDIQRNIDSWGRFSALSPWNFAWWPALVRTKNHIAAGQVKVENAPVAEPEDTQESEDGSEANRYIATMLKFFMLVQLWKNIALVPLLIFPTTYSFVKRKLPQTQMYRQAMLWLKRALSWTKDVIGDRKEALVPKPLIGLVGMALYGDRKILNILGNTIDEASSNLVIAFMFVAGLVGSLVVVMQVQQETSFLVRMSGQFLNRTFTEHPEYLEWIPGGAQLQNQLQSSVDSFYMYSRTFVEGLIKNAVAGDNETNNEAIANEVMTVMDRIYFAYMSQNATNGTSLELIPTEVPASLSSTFSWSFFRDYVTSNFETIYSVLNSVTSILTENAALIASMATSIFSFIVTYFSQFLDFILNAIFFLASLSFLLSLSGDQYYPLEKIAKATEYFPEAGNVAYVIETTINGIFNASLKMALFYGIYIYTLLSIFEIYVRFIPSCVAGIFAVIPLFPTYISCVPALIEIMFVRQDYFLTALLAIGAYMPSTFVDEVMYKEVRTAHPYIFGLSVAGGLMTMGIEGVIVGPIVLCAFVTATELARMILKPPEPPPSTAELI